MAMPNRTKCDDQALCCAFVRVHVGARAPGISCLTIVDNLKDYRMCASPAHAIYFVLFCHLWQG